MSEETPKPSVLTQLLAPVCVCCPICIARRRWPDSAYGRLMARVERACPFCRAYDRLHPPEAGQP